MRKGKTQAQTDRINETRRARYQVRKDVVLAQGKAYRDANKEAVAERARARYQANHEKVRAHQKERYATDPAVRAAGVARTRAWKAANPERKRELNAKWQRDHPEYLHGYSAANSEKIVERVRQWRVDNPEKRRAQARSYANRRRTRLRSGEVESFVDLEIFERDDWVCQLVLCVCPDGRSVDPQLRHPDPWSPSLDHIIPVSKGGSHTRENVQTSHFKCNLTKHNKNEIKETA